MAKNLLELGPSGPGPSARFLLAIRHGHWATSLEAWARSLEPWAFIITNRSLHELYKAKIRKFKNKCSRNFKCSKMFSFLQLHCHLSNKCLPPTFQISQCQAKFEKQPFPNLKFTSYHGHFQLFKVSTARTCTVLNCKHFRISHILEHVFPWMFDVSRVQQIILL